MEDVEEASELLEVGDLRQDAVPGELGEQLASEARNSIATLKTKAANYTLSLVEEVTLLVLKTLQGSLDLLELCNNS